MISTTRLLTRLQTPPQPPPPNLSPAPSPIGRSLVLVTILKMLRQGSNSGRRLWPALLNCVTKRFINKSLEKRDQYFSMMSINCLNPSCRAYALLIFSGGNEISCNCWEWTCRNFFNLEQLQGVGEEERDENDVSVVRASSRASPTSCGPLHLLSTDDAQFC
ncbi:hypothetical protein REPUB_Repub06bG0220800 [Reevesia pubescens]